MSHRDPGEAGQEEEEAARLDELTDEAIVEWLSRDPQRPDSREFRERVMRDIRRRRPNIHREALSARRRGPLARLRLSSITTKLALALTLGFAAGFVAGAAFGGLPRNGEPTPGVTVSHPAPSVVTRDRSGPDTEPTGTSSPAAF